MNFLLINKPEGWTSFDVVAFVRKKIRCHPEFICKSSERKASIYFSERAKQICFNYISGSSEMLKQVQHDKQLRVGHAGTLDPFATGLLIVGVGREATKRLDEFKAMPKTYIATIKLGEVSDTYDRTGKISDYRPRTSDLRQPTSSVLVPSPIRGGTEGGVCEKRNRLDKYPLPCPPPNRGRNDEIKQIKKVIKSFKGKQLQIPPMFSAKKINGKKLYELARQGITVERKPNEIEIYKIKILDYSWPLLKIEVRCSAGTYIRSLAHDIGQKLGTGAYCQNLTRTKIGKYDLSKASDINGLNISTL